jgi:uncharacterized protein YceK
MFAFSKLIKISSLLSALLMVGCASLSVTFNPDPKFGQDKNPIYAGTRFDAMAIAAPFDGPSSSDPRSWPDPIFWVFYPLFIVDLPLSMVMDTLLLPYTISHHSKTKQSETFNMEDAWRQLVKWRSLKRGMTESDVRSILGEPQQVETFSSFSSWAYPGGGKTVFDRDGRLDAWSEPY